MEIRRLQPGKRMSQAVVHNNTVYLAGQVADQTRQDVAGQTRQVMSAIDRLLAQAGTDKTKILTATIVLADMATFADMNAVWDTWSPKATPRRAPPSKPNSPRRNTRWKSSSPRRSDGARSRL